MISGLRHRVGGGSKNTLVSGTAIVLGAALVLYTLGYLHHPVTPGNNPDFPLGWWGWFDQSNYLKSARAFQNGNLAPNEHFYPPVYSLIGAVGLFSSLGHPFFFVNGIALVFVVHVMVRLGCRYIPRWASIAVVFAVCFVCDRVRDAYVVPWTSTITAACFALGLLGGLWLVESAERQRMPSLARVGLVGFGLGLVVPTRPADAVVVVVVGLGLVVTCCLQRSRIFTSVRDWIRPLSVFVIAGLLGPAFYLWFNSYVYGDAFGGYLAAGSANGLPLRDLPEKSVSMFLDGSTVYGEPGGGITDQYPWLLLGIPLMIVALITGDALLRLVGAYVVGMFALYLPFGDLLPTGIWRFQNVHYFKLALALVALLAAIGLSSVARMPRRQLLVVVPVIGLSSLGMLFTSWSISGDQVVAQLQAGAISVPLPEKTVDLIDVSDVVLDWNQVYFGPHTVKVDGVELDFVKDFRVLPMPGRARVLFVRPVRGKVASVSLGKQTPDVATDSRRIGVFVGSMKLALGHDRVVGVNSKQLALAAGEVVAFGQGSLDQPLLASGWSVPEVGGRWSEGDQSTLSLLIGPDVKSIRIIGAPFLSTMQPCQTVTAKVDGQETVGRRICSAVPWTSLELPITNAQSTSTTNGRSVTVVLSTPDSISPQEVGGGPDPRRLGLRLVRLELSSAAPAGAVAPS